jgi:hypothetical protein
VALCLKGASPILVRQTFWRETENPVVQAQRVSVTLRAGRLSVTFD